VDAPVKRLVARFFRQPNGGEPVREWLLDLPREDRRRIGADIATVEFGWPVGMPTCRPMGSGLWEVRTDLLDRRTARVLFCIVGGQMILLHGFVKKDRKAPRPEVNLARKRMDEVTE